jgi:tRNA threonylcarbamoyladenosine biosynthesis protein TsaB
MNILAVDSSTDVLSVAVAAGDGFAEAALDLGLRHAERIMGLVDFCLRGAGLERGDLGLVACAKGPGSFTGLRIGMAASKGIAAGLGLPWVAVPTLDALAWGYEAFHGAVVPLIDGKKGRVFSAAYLRGERATGWLDIPLAELAALLDTYPDVLFTGPDAELARELASQRSGFAIDRRARTPAARGLAALAAEILERDGPTPVGEGPLYLRPSEAEEPRPAGAGA